MENISVNCDEKTVKDIEKTDIDMSSSVFTDKIEKNEETECFSKNSTYHDVSTENQENASVESLKRNQKSLDDETTLKETKKIKKDLKDSEIFKKELLNNGSVEDSGSSKVDKNVLYKTEETTDPIHQLTCSIYVGNFTRPLQIPQLKSYLLDVIKDIDDSNDDILKKIWMDKFRTHAFIVFSTIKQAKRVREVLHNSIWPCEKGRKPLWVDYIPENKVDEWIYIEEQSSRDTKWKVVYDAQGTADLLKIEKKVSHENAVIPNEEAKKQFQDKFNEYDEKKQNIEKYNLNKLFLKTQTTPSLYYKTTGHNIVVDKFKIQNNLEHKINM
ncbi:uncharacterized protein T551_02112 [Pneumocystis jirovecii RU7]|uniref:RRM domain-containing protein n=1 Tax=Pneumocystis jirovecii (strain RU7) TaxID=1408657 RepID=A0A0W4ZM81_PNEJ7|nr:uncharacterized protein T551_02112 [Pneumocystis jirovecii RU7]KTW29496.1 hypothetical protein T551_02112 [Pneumocystis jirovecii RU7]